MSIFYDKFMELFSAYDYRFNIPCINHSTMIFDIDGCGQISIDWLCEINLYNFIHPNTKAVVLYNGEKNTGNACFEILFDGTMFIRDGKGNYIRLFPDGSYSSHVTGGEIVKYSIATRHIAGFFNLIIETHRAIL